MNFTQDDEELIPSSAKSEVEVASNDASAAYELIYHIDVSKEPSLSIYEENAQQKVSFYLPLNGSVTSRDEAEKLAVALANRINRRIEELSGNG